MLVLRPPFWVIFFIIFSTNKGFNLTMKPFFIKLHFQLLQISNHKHYLRALLRSTAATTAAGAADQHFACPVFVSYSGGDSPAVFHFDVSRESIPASRWPLRGVKATIRPFWVVSAHCCYQIYILVFSEKYSLACSESSFGAVPFLCCLTILTPSYVASSAWTQKTLTAVLDVFIEYRQLLPVKQTSYIYWQQLVAL